MPAAPPASGSTSIHHCGSVPIGAFATEIRGWARPRHGAHVRNTIIPKIRLLLRISFSLGFHGPFQTVVIHSNTHTVFLPFLNSPGQRLQEIERVLSGAR